MENKIRYLGASTLCCMALLLAGCGGSDSGSEAKPAAQDSATQAAKVVKSDLGPDANGNYPDANGLYPDASGRYPDANGFYPDSAGRYPDSNGLYPDSNGVYTPSGAAGMFANEDGVAHIHSTDGVLDTNNPFFKAFGNGRSCVSCHAQEDGFSITPKNLQARFNKTHGNDPIFLPVDGANSPKAPVATIEDKRQAYSLLLNKGLIRIGKPIPTMTNDAPPRPAEFVLDSVVDPYNFATDKELSLFRRPLPSANLRFLSAVMWDSRETIKVTPADPLNYSQCIRNPNTPAATWNCYAPYDQALMFQADNATKGHAQAAAGLTAEEQKAIVDFELKLYSAQHISKAAGFLSQANVKGGTKELTAVDYYFDIGSVFGDPKTGIPSAISKLTAMQLFGAWTDQPASRKPNVILARQSIARGEKIFNTRTFQMVNVAGTRFPTINGATCTNCHSTPQVGSLGQPNLFGLGIGDPAWSSSPDLPTYTLRNVVPGPDFGKTVVTQDPGLAVMTGKWGDIGKFKVPSLRGLASRAPYFHDGSAKTIEETTNFYIRRLVYDNPLTSQDIDDLNAFLKSL